MAAWRAVLWPRLPKVALLGSAVQRRQYKNVVFLVSGHDGNKKVGQFPKEMDFGPKKCIFGPKISFFLRYTHITHFFGLRRTRLNGIIISPCPEVTLDTFGFPVDGRLAARRAVSRPRLPKVALFGPKNAVFWPEINFWWTASKKIVTIMTGRLKDNGFALTALQGGLRGGIRALLWAKNGPKI